MHSVHFCHNLIHSCQICSILMLCIYLADRKHSGFAYANGKYFSKMWVIEFLFINSILYNYPLLQKKIQNSIWPENLRKNPRIPEKNIRFLLYISAHTHINFIILIHLICYLRTLNILSSWSHLYCMHVYIRPIFMAVLDFFHSVKLS